MNGLGRKKKCVDWILAPLLVLLSISNANADGGLESQSCNCAYSGAEYRQTKSLRGISNSITNAAESSSLQPSHLGFFDPNNPDVPAVIRNAAKSVMFIAAPSGDITTVAELFNGHSIDEVINKIEGMSFTDDFGKPDKDVFLFQLRQCKQQSEDQGCRLYDSVSLSTAYVVADGTRLRTAFHAVGDLGRASVSHSTELTNSETIRFSIPVFVYDSEGELVTGPTKQAMPTGEFSRENLQYNFKESGRMTLPNDDLVEIQFNTKIAEPLKAAVSPVQVGNVVYTLGYPHKTKDRKPYGVPDAPGQRLKVAFGNVLPIDQAYLKMGKDPNLTPSDLRAFYQKAMIVTDADGAPGQSGGVTLNSNGEVVGTYTAGFPADGSANLNHVSFSSNDFYKLKTPND